MLSDEEAARIEGQIAAADRVTLGGWLRALLDDRRARSSLLQGQARRLAHARQRLRQAHAYLDGLLRQAEEDARSPWPGKLRCPRCGAATAMVRAEQRAEGHAIVHDHPDGARCEQPRNRGGPVSDRNPE